MSWGHTGQHPPCITPSCYAQARQEDPLVKTGQKKDHDKFPEYMCSIVLRALRKDILLELEQVFHRRPRPDTGSGEGHAKSTFHIEFLPVLHGKPPSTLQDTLLFFLLFLAPNLCCRGHFFSWLNLPLVLINSLLRIHRI